MLREFLDKIDDYSTLLSVYSALDDILQLLVAGLFDYKVDTLAYQLPESQHSQDDGLSAEKVALVASVVDACQTSTLLTDFSLLFYESTLYAETISCLLL